MSLISLPLRSISPVRLRRLSRRRSLERALSVERRRIARNLHDGLAQELAFTSMHSRRLAERDEVAGDVADAAERALLETRAAIERLRDESDGPLCEAVARTAREMTEGSNAALELDLYPRVELEPKRRENLLRILREAVWNALRHGGATTIRVKLSGDYGLRLSVADNGVGFEANDLPENRTSFGLTSMTERATELGGELGLSSRPRAGTTVEVTLR